MTIYISGPISGLPLEEARSTFKAAEGFLAALSLKPVNPLDNGLPDDAPWIEHITRDLEMLHDCEAIYMMDGWQQSLGASIEYDFATRTGKHILFERHLQPQYDSVLRIQAAIHEATGLQLYEYRSKGRKSEKYFARMLFAHLARQCNMRVKDIAAYIKRDPTSILHLLNKYRNEVKYNPTFRAQAEEATRLMEASGKQAESQGRQLTNITIPN